MNTKRNIELFKSQELQIRVDTKKINKFLFDNDITSDFFDVGLESKYVCFDGKRVQLRDNPIQGMPIINLSELVGEKKRHEFKVGDGMSLENSTAEQRKETWELLIQKGFPTMNKDYKVIMSDVLNRQFFFNGAEWHFPFDVKKYEITNDIPYQQMKSLILGDDVKWNWDDAVFALRDRSHQLFLDESDLSVAEILNAADFYIAYGTRRNNYVYAFSKHTKYCGVNPYPEKPIILLSNIEEKKNPNGIKVVEHEVVGKPILLKGKPILVSIDLQDFYLDGNGNYIKKPTYTKSECEEKFNCKIID